MPFTCLPKKLVDAFKRAMIDRTINPDVLSSMTSIQRHEFLTKIIGDDYAGSVNALFESKLLLKNQKLGMVRWAEKTLGLNKVAKRDIISRIEKLDKVLNPVEEKAFLEDLINQKLGIGVSLEEARGIYQLSQKINEAKSKMKDDFTFPSEESRLDYGSRVVEMMNYLGKLKETSLSETVKGYTKEPVKIISDIAGIAKSLKASLDNSAIFRQGWKTLMTNPLIWLKNAKKSFFDIAKELRGQSAMDAVNADILSRQNFLNGKYKQEKLAISTIEEAYPSQLPEKIPVFSRAYKASQSAFMAFVYRQRADIFDLYTRIAEKSGAETAGIGKVVNSLTGRGSLGALERGANIVNNIFFSPRFLKSQIDTLTAHTFQKDISPFARKQAAVNLLKVVTGTSAILVLANAIKPGSVEWDPRSSDFGKIRVEDTRFDMTGGMSSLITLVSRLVKKSTKSSITGVVSKLDTGEFGASTSLDVVYNFFENKLSPVSSVIKDLLKGETFGGGKPTIGGEISNLIVPLPITTGIELWKNPNSANFLVSIMADVLGISTNTYSAESNWKDSTGVEMEQFRKKVGEDEFTKANQLYNKRVNDWIAVVVNDPKFKSLLDEEKKSVISKKKSEIKDIIFRQYGFKYRQEKKKQLPKF